MPSGEFHSPLALWLLCALPLLAVLALIERRRRVVVRFSATTVLGKQGRGVRTYFLWLPAACRVAAFGFALLALARPQERVAHPPDLSVDGIDPLVAFDRCPSM